ncbi:MAG TPA: biotin/lipoyl-binding protein, partial [Candidatus Latescibacteria bacterium]|nr:biotin/lipoyl-binding protein [Candidatus Latescibacterota bacterium]
MTGTPAKRKKKLLRIFLFFGAAAAIGAIVYFNLKKEKEEPTFPTVRVERGNLIDKLADTGSIELVRTVEIKSTISGRIRELPVEAGDWVEEGQLLAVIEPDPNQSLLLYQKRSAVERGQLNLAEQERDVARKKALRVDSMLPAKELEDAETRLTRVRNDLRLARLELEVL